MCRDDRCGLEVPACDAVLPDGVAVGVAELGGERVFLVGPKHRRADVVWDRDSVAGLCGGRDTGLCEQETGARDELGA